MRGIKGSARVQEPEKMEGKLLVTFPIPGNNYVNTAENQEPRYTQILFIANMHISVLYK